MAASVSEAAAALRADLALLDAATKEAASLLDLASWQLGELGRQALPMIDKTQALARAKENISTAKLRSEEVLEHLDASRKMQSVIQAGPRAHLEGFLVALDRLEAAVDFLQAHRSMASAEDALRHTTALRDSGLAACNREFAALLQKHSAVPQALLARLRTGVTAAEPGQRASLASLVDPEGGQSAPPELLPEPVLAKLQALASALLRGSNRSVVGSYADARRGVLQSSLATFLAPFAGSREEQARLSWAQWEAKLPGWVAALRLYVQLAQEEARLCAAVFPPSEQPAVLAQVAASGAAALLEAADQVLAARRVPEKLFGVLGMHDACEACLPPLRAALAANGSRLCRASAAGGESAPPVVAQLGQLRDRLAAEVRACFAELQDSVVRDAARGAPADGTVHPLCASAVALLRRVLAYESALPVLFGDAAGGASAQPGGGGLAREARLLERMGAAAGHLFDTLLAALDANARASLKSRALAALHEMNNAAHILHACQAGRELKAVGEGWAERNKGKVEACQQQYIELAWGPLLALLRQDARAPAGSPSGDKGARQAIKDRWTAVNKALAEVEGQQSWAVPDAALRFAIRDEVSDRVVPLYEAFVAKYKQVDFSGNRGKYERYSPADVARLVNALFERAEAGGAPALVGRSPSRSPSTGGAGLSRKLSKVVRGGR